MAIDEDWCNLDLIVLPSKEQYRSHSFIHSFGKVVVLNKFSPLLGPTRTTAQNTCNCFRLVVAAEGAASQENRIDKSSLSQSLYSPYFKYRLNSTRFVLLCQRCGSIIPGQNIRYQLRKIHNEHLSSSEYSQIVQMTLNQDSSRYVQLAQGTSLTGVNVERFRMR